VFFRNSPEAGVVRIRKKERTTFGPCALLENMAILSCAYCQVPENGIVAALLVLNEPVAMAPDAC